MRRLSIDELDALSERYDEAVLRSENLDRFCSSAHWILPAARYLHRSPPPAIAQEGDCWVLLGGEPYLHALEATWGLACPLVGADSEALVELLFHLLADVTWHGLLLTGIVPGSRLQHILVSRLVRCYSLSSGPSTRRYVADVSDGLEGFLSKRSGDFRKGLRRARRRASARNLFFEVADGLAAQESFDRILDVERRSWKGVRRVGIDSEPMRSFYQEMNRRLCATGSRRLSFARADGQDVAYILGGVLGRTYRGLQFSFDRRYEDLSLGNLCQVEEIQRLTQEGIQRYDLGMEVAYKKRWADTVVTTTSLVVRRSSPSP